MGSGNKKKKGIDMGNYVPKEIEQKAYVWCIHNNIFIAPEAKSTTEWHICITLNGKTNKSPLVYEKVEIWKEIYKFYLYYYNKYSGEKIIKEAEPKKVVQQKPEEEQKDKPIVNTLF